MIMALFYTLLVKFSKAPKFALNNKLGWLAVSNEYLSWILADVACLLTLEVILLLFCSTWPRKWIVRIATIVAAAVCTWSIMNAAWLIRTGNQILPRILLSLIRDPVSALGMVGVNLAKMPVAASILLVPSAIALTFFISCLARPRLPAYNRKRLSIQIMICVTITVVALAVRPGVAKRGSRQIGAVGLRHNAQLRAVMSLVRSDYRQQFDPKRTIPPFDQIKITAEPWHPKYNVLVVVLEGVQYGYTSFAGGQGDLTPFMTKLASQGVEFSNTRSSLTHSTKALFSLFSGRFPSASQDIVEAVPAVKPYGGIATVLRDKLGYRTAYFQSAAGKFESRAGLVYNLGFQKFWSRDDLDDPNAFVGYLGSDEFSLLKPVTDWIKEDKQPFFAALFCSVTHDPYVVPEWFGEPAKEPAERYRQSVFYTDKFLAALDVELARLNLTDETILCVISDHGEAFGEHGLLGHNRIPFDELLHIPFCLRAPSLVEPGSKITRPVSSIDVTPTLLSLLGFETKSAGFDGWDVLGPVPEDRNVYFVGWMQEGPMGYVRANRKFVYHPPERTACLYDLDADPLELVRIELPEQEAQEFTDEIIAWRKDTIIRPNQVRTGRKVLFDRWECSWSNRVSWSKYKKKPK